jgi:hypothetical protein
VELARRYSNNGADDLTFPAKQKCNRRLTPAALQKN